MRNRNHWSGLDGLRGFACLLVLWEHLSFFFKITWIDGHYGVSIFFVLSAYLLTDYFLRNKQAIRQSFELKRYFLRRFLRIVPVYWIAVLVEYYLLGFKKEFLLVPALLLLKPYGHYWTLSVEGAYYLLLVPIVFLFTDIFKKSLLLCILFLLVALIPFVTFKLYLEQSNESTFINHYPVMLLGSVLALVQLHLESVQRKTKLWFFDTLGAISFAVMLVRIHPDISEFLYKGAPESTVFERTVLSGALLIAVANGNILSRVFSVKPLTWLGIISYGTYLFHMMVFRSLHKTGFSVNNFPGIPLFLLGSVFVGFLSWHLIEKRLLGLVR